MSRRSRSSSTKAKASGAADVTKENHGVEKETVADQLAAKKHKRRPQAKASPKSRFGGVFVLFLLTWGVIGGLGWYGYQYLVVQNTPVRQPLPEKEIRQLEEVIASLEEKIALLESEQENLHIEIAEQEHDVLPDTLPVAVTNDDSDVEEAAPEVRAEPNIDEADHQVKKVHDPSKQEAATLSVPVKLVPLGATGENELEKDGLIAGLADISDRTVALEEKLYQLDQYLQAANQKQKQSELVLYVVQLRDAVLQHEPFTKELAVVKKAYHGQDETVRHYLQTLQEHAATGIPKKSELMNSFNHMADGVVHISRQQKESPTLMDTLLVTFPKLVKVRKIEDTASADGPVTGEDIVARAYQQLKKGYVNSAVSALSALEGRQKELAIVWMKEAQSYVDVRQAIDGVFHYLTSGNTVLPNENAETAE